MSDELINLKTSRHEIIKSQCAQAASKFMQNRKLSHHANLFQSYDFFKQDKCFWLWVAYVLIWSSMRDSYLYYHLLFQICWDKTHTKKFCHKLIKYLNSDQYINKYSAFNKMIHEIMNSVTISADKAAAVWENKNKQVRKKNNQTIKSHKLSFKKNKHY